MSESPEQPGRSDHGGRPGLPGRGEAASLGAADVALPTAQELLRIAGELFGALMAVDHPFTDADHGRVKSLHLILAEVDGRAARLFAQKSSPCACSCGASFQTPEELDEHFWEVFVPLDDQGLDGKSHAELARAGSGAEAGGA